MTNFCAEHHHHKFHPSHQLFSSKKPLQDIDIPPRKQLLRRSAAPPSAANLHETAADLFSDETPLQKFLPYNGNPDDDDSDPYSSDHFRIFEFKVRRCTRSRSHDWTDCPFAHPGEKARRRDPRKYQYSGTVCPDYRRGGCSRGDGCEFAHGVFECWLHPARYRTEACKDGKNCKRKVCFFAHSPRQLRILSSPQEMSPEMSPVTGERKYRNSSSQNHCCLLCHHCGAASSPTSTLMGISHLSPPLSPSQSLSPPLSPLKHRSASGFSPISRYNDRYPIVESNNLSQFRTRLSYKNVLTELMSSLEAMNFNEASPISGVPNRNFPEIDVSQLEDQQQFILSPSTTNPDSSENYFGGNCSSRSFSAEEMKLSDNGFSSSDPDLGWVNDLLM